MPARARLDAELVRRGLVRSRTEASDLIAEGRVRVAGSPAAKPATAVAPDTPLTIVDSAADRRYASRGGHKLAGALDELGVDVMGRVCLDAGASTGGFTDVLLRRGATQVHAVDVGYGQLNWGLRNDPRVAVHDRVNVRALDPASLGGPVDVTVADLSFISLVLVLPALRRATRHEGELVVLVKPQFEVGRELIGKGGVVRDRGARGDAVRAVAAAAGTQGMAVAGVAASQLPGPSGNVEFFLHLRPAGTGLSDDEFAVALAAAVAFGPGEPT